jgi:ribonuclease HII
MKWIVGIDEVGRGPVAGPVAVCTCAISITQYKKLKWLGLNDSKKMSVKSRNEWYKKALELKQNGSIKYSVIYKSNVVIDQRGISFAIRSCISEALKNLNLKPKNCRILLDGSLKAPKEYKNQRTIIKGDQKEKIISLASVIAKVSRDTKMELLHKKYPKYNWVANKGYGTKEHYRAIRKYGQTLLHRKTFLTKI